MVEGAKELAAARAIGATMNISPEQLFWKEGEVWYRSLDYGDLNEVAIPSADFVTIRNRLEKGKGWGNPSSEAIAARPVVEHTLNAKRIEDDMQNYSDGQFIQYISTGGPCNFELPFRTVEIEANYPMNENAVEKTERKFQEELELGYVGLRGSEMAVFRETKQGAIPKSRRDRQRKAEGVEYNCRTISDFSAPGTDEISINEEAGVFAKLALPQGERIHANLWEVYDFCVANGLDPKGIRGMKVDIKSAFRILITHPSDAWALCFRVGEKRAFHKRWPFGLKASVYMFLRLPLLIITYLVEQSRFTEWGARAGMYFDDLMVFAHESMMGDAAQTVIGLFRRWGIPLQEEKFVEDNPEGLKGSSRLVILGLLYDLAILTIAIPRPRLLEIVEEMQAFIGRKGARKLKEWESITGIINWTTVAIPQLRMYLTNTWRMIRAIKYKNKRNRRQENPRVKMLEDIQHDWGEIMHHLKGGNGKQRILRDEWKSFPEEGYSVEENWIAPASDASGSWGWGAVCEYGFAFGEWKEKEKDLKIHIKEGLGLFALIAMFGKELSGERAKLTIRCDNQSITSALAKGRAKDRDLAIVMRLVVEAMIRVGIMLRFWKTGAKSEVAVEYIRSRENKLADALSRGAMDEFTEITNKIDSFQAIQKRLCKEDVERWENAVGKIIGDTPTQKTPKELRVQE